MRPTHTSRTDSLTRLQVRELEARAMAAEANAAELANQKDAEVITPFEA